MPQQESSSAYAMDALIAFATAAAAAVTAQVYVPEHGVDGLQD